MSAERQTDKVVQTWAKTHRVVPSEYYEPTKLSEIQDVVRRATSTGKTLRVVGSGHSPNDCVMTTDIILSLKRFNQLLTIDLENRLVKVQAGITLEDLNEALAKVGLALPTLGSVSEQSIAGAIATGTHGTGISIGAISESIAELQLVLADGSVAICSKAVRQGS
jgi:FAD/FMN-containing dehydrogenase